MLGTGDRAVKKQSSCHSQGTDRDKLVNQKNPGPILKALLLVLLMSWSQKFSLSIIFLQRSGIIELLRVRHLRVNHGILEN